MNSDSQFKLITATLQLQVIYDLWLVMLIILTLQNVRGKKRVINTKPRIRHMLEYGACFTTHQN